MGLTTGEAEGRLASARKALTTGAVSTARVTGTKAKAAGNKGSEYVGNHKGTITISILTFLAGAWLRRMGA